MKKQSHNYDHSHDHRSINPSSIKLTLFLNTCLTIIEFIGFILTNSVMLSSSAIHDLGDSIILFFSYLLERKSLNPRSDKYSYGYRRFTLLASILNSFILCSGAVVIFINSYINLRNPQNVDAKLLFFFAIFGILSNGIGAYKLSQDKSLSSRSLFLNITSDLVSWLIIMFSSILIYFYHIYIIDPLISLFLSIWLLYLGIRETRKIIVMLMQAVPDNININEIHEFIFSFGYIVDVHDLHVWSLDGDDIISSFHIVVSDELPLWQVMELKEEIKIALEDHGINHTTIEIDTISTAKKNGEL